MEGCIPVEYLDMDIVTGRYKRYVFCLEQDFNERYINRLIILGVLFCKHTKSNTRKKNTNDCLLPCKSGLSQKNSHLNNFCPADDFLKWSCLIFLFAILLIFKVDKNLVRMIVHLLLSNFIAGLSFGSLPLH